MANIASAINEAEIRAKEESFIPVGTECFEYDEVSFFETSRYIFRHGLRPKKQLELGYKLVEEGEENWIIVQDSHEWEREKMTIAESTGDELAILHFTEDWSARLHKHDLDAVYGIMHCFGHVANDRKRFKRTIVPKF